MKMLLSVNEITHADPQVDRTLDRQAARYLVDVADAISSVKSGQTSYGEFYVSEAIIGFDGDDTQYRIVPNEHGDYSITVVDPPRPELAEDPTLFP